MGLPRHGRNQRSRSSESDTIQALHCPCTWAMRMLNGLFLAPRPLSISFAALISSGWMQVPFTVAVWRSLQSIDTPSQAQNGDSSGG